MPCCPRCETEFEAAELERHEHDGLVVVHCPDCGRTMGTYNGRAGRRRRRESGA